ncbi:MAG: helix-turn-helix transcriptional regulator [Burkholderiales bacterium]|nr:helix-turn-helix transcriptional regulator [Opitutaceae bacterium]
MTILALTGVDRHAGEMSNRTVSEPGFISRQVSRARRFYFGHATHAAKGALEVAGGGWERVAKHYTINRATFPWLAIEFVAGGSGRLIMRGVSHDLKRGVVFAYGPGVEHRIETDAKELLSKHYLNFSGREAADLMSAIGLEPGACRVLGNADEVEEGFEALIDEGAADRQQAPAIAALQLRILFLKMADAKDATEPGELRARQMLRRCLAHIDAHFLEVRTIQEVAQACHVSVGHLTRSFMRFGYGSPYRYLTRKKMLHAAALLDSGTMLAREVADRLALDPFQFSRVFKRVHGISPSDFVRRHGLGRK